MNVRFGAAKVVIGNTNKPGNNDTDLTSNIFEASLKASLSSFANQILLEQMDDEVEILFTREQIAGNSILKMKATHPSAQTCDNLTPIMAQTGNSHATADITKKINDFIKQVASAFSTGEDKYINKKSPLVPLVKDDSIKTEADFFNK